MGDGASKAGSADDDEDAEGTKAPPGGPAPEEENYARLLQGGLDAEAAFGAAFADDAATLEQIRRIAQELAGQRGGHAGVAQEVKRLEELAKVAERREKRANKAATRQAQEQADSWLHRQVRQDTAEEAAAQRRAVDAAAQRQSEEGARQRRVKEEGEAEAARRVARREAEARALLREEAAEAALSNQPAGSVFSGIPLPAPPHEPDSGDGSPPPPPPPPPPNAAGVPAAEPPPEFYRLLGVSFDATFDEIKRGYRRQAMLWHPDKNRHRLEQATERFKCISEAFDTLYDPKKRADYDAGKVQTQGKAKKLQGHGWSSKSDEDDETLTPLGIKYKKASWRGYVLLYGRIDDDPEQIVQDENDPRAPQEKVKIFWRHMGEMAYEDREAGEDDRWLQNFIAKVWKDTPSRWPGAAELKAMNEASQQEWKERRMVYNRRKQKVQIHIDLHEEYLAIPNREKKEIERIQKRRPGWAARMSVGVNAVDPMRVV